MVGVVVWELLSQEPMDWVSSLAKVSMAFVAKASLVSEAKASLVYVTMVSWALTFSIVS